MDYQSFDDCPKRLFGIILKTLQPGLWAHSSRAKLGRGPSFSASNHLPRVPEFITYGKHAELLKFLDA
jgi:hypothetical protein